ncbi:unnamed protein product [Amoebophrya sp. A25]|nr:unnamed protein product [Amoebophrya sp. A25]|eukprot:GSA25T00019151001.1
MVTATREIPHEEVDEEEQVDLVLDLLESFSAAMTWYQQKILLLLKATVSVAERVRLLTGEEEEEDSMLGISSSTEKNAEVEEVQVGQVSSPPVIAKTIIEEAKRRIVSKGHTQMEDFAAEARKDFANSTYLADLRVKYNLFAARGEQQLLLRSMRNSAEEDVKCQSHLSVAAQKLGDMYGKFLTTIIDTTENVLAEGFAKDESTESVGNIEAALDSLHDELKTVTATLAPDEDEDEASEAEEDVLKLKLHS